VQFAAPLTANPRAPLAESAPLARIAAALVLMGFLFAAVDLVTAGLLLAVVLVSVPLLGIGYRQLAGRTVLLVLAAVVIGLVNAVLGQPRGPLVVSIGPLALHQDTLISGVALGMRILAIALSGFLALAGVEPTDLADALIQQLHVSPRFALGALAAVRLLPALAEQWQLMGLARRARGLSARSPLDWIALQGGKLAALLVVALRQGTRLATAMEARGLGSGERTVARPQHWRGADSLLIAGAFVCGAAATAVSIGLGSYRFLFG
jgi:energy-coupling factor transport system permease protein